MVYNAKIKEFNTIVEEEIRVEIDGIDIICFSNFLTPNMKIGDIYKAKLELTILDSITINEIHESKKELERIDNTFSYIIRGKLQNGMIDAGIKLKIDPDNLDGYWNLDNKYVEMRGVDRISIDFI